MTRGMKLGMVAAGYALAVFAGVMASLLYNVRMSAMPYDTSGGMYAGGELLSVLGVFLVAALVPTLLALWFLRDNATVWRAIAIASVAFACAGLLAVLMPLAVRDPIRHPALLPFSLLGLAQLLGVPLWTGAFGLFASLAPTRPARRWLLAATGIELVIGVCAAIHWFVPSPPF